mmetsp:Transcript_27223/g.57252  ORF Transcript_27223/g.57252 Transcript_27223/m.57252 type:complete len:219 (+) Transcript_27223:1907-2563(+)
MSVHLSFRTGISWVEPSLGSSLSSKLSFESSVGHTDKLCELESRVICSREVTASSDSASCGFILILLDFASHWLRDFFEFEGFRFNSCRNTASSFSSFSFSLDSSDLPHFDVRSKLSSDVLVKTSPVDSFGISVELSTAVSSGTESSSCTTLSFETSAGSLLTDTPPELEDTTIGSSFDELLDESMESSSGAIEEISCESKFFSSFCLLKSLFSSSCN